MIKEIICCGQVLIRGSGYFPTDYKCPRCSHEYNSNGNLLTPRSQWGEETGEQF
jgi:phage FluMu protein Com